MSSTHYDVLGVSRNASVSEIKDKFRAAARKYHPDVAVDKMEAARMFVQINRAYRVLRDAEQRQKYDCSLSPHMANGVSPSPPPMEDVSQTVLQAEGAFLQGRLPEARALCAKVLKQDGRHARALALLGDILLGQGKPDEAAVAFRLSLQVAPNSVLQGKLTRLAQASAVRQPSPQTAFPQNQPEERPAEPKPASLLSRLFHKT